MNSLLSAGKGGGGKSTTAFNLAVVARRAGLRVGLIDADPQRSLSDMRVARGHADIPVQACRVEELPEKLALARQSALEHLIIDMPPGIGAHTLAAIGLADFVILPMRPTIFDLRATVTGSTCCALPINRLGWSSTPGRRAGKVSMHRRCAMRVTLCKASASSPGPGRSRID